MAPTKLETLRSLEMFSAVAPPQLESLARSAVARDYNPGDVLFLEGQPCEGIWIVGAGAVQIVKTTPNGRQLVLATQTAPATWAEVPVFDGGPYPASVIAVQPSRALLLLKHDFLALCRAEPEVALEFLRTFGRRLRQLVGLAERVTFGTIRQRLALDLPERASLAGADAFQMDETQEQLAARLGTVREVISRNLGRFQCEGLLRVERKSVVIADRAGLESEASTEL